MTTEDAGGSRENDRKEWKRPFAELPLSFQFKLIHDRFTARLNVRLKECDLTLSQNHILMYLARNRSRKVYQKELCEAMKVTHPTMIGLISRLSEKGLAESVVDEDNRRFRVIRLTEKGERFLNISRQDHDSANEVLVRGFSEEERRQLTEYLDRVYHNMIEAGMPGPGDAK